jgi:hypothetical protein
MKSNHATMSNIGVCDITSPSNDEFHKEWPWICLDIINAILSLISWHLIVFSLLSSAFVDIIFTPMNEALELMI